MVQWEQKVPGKKKPARYFQAGIHMSNGENHTESTVSDSSRYLSKISALLVEDEEYLRESLSRILERRVGVLYQAANGKEGLELFIEKQPDIIITDIRMPLLDGLEMSEQIKKLNPEVPILITTAHNDEEFFIKAIDTGIDKYIKKPVNRNSLFRAMIDMAKTIIQKKEIEAKNRFIHMILDANPEFILICDDNNVSYLNRSFLNFFNCNSFAEFREKFGDLKEYLLTDEGQLPYTGGICELIHSLTSANEEGSSDQTDFLIRLKKPGQNQSSDEIQTYIARVNSMVGYSETLVTLSNITSIEKEKQHYAKLSSEDPLTGIYNRKRFQEELEKERERAIRNKRDLSLIFFDIDFFKKVNDTYGHLTGDQVLKKVTELVAHSIRSSDFFARYGGEEFIILLPELSAKKAADLAEKLRVVIAEAEYPEAGKLTCSFGVAALQDSESAENLVNRADQALYQAKNDGRNLVRISEADGS